MCPPPLFALQVTHAYRTILKHYLMGTHTHTHSIIYQYNNTKLIIRLCIYQWYMIIHYPFCNNKTFSE
ncbi:hypothetical protein HanRHA438_Chr03g0144451 [Helianthus annuus]|nr:hypothetical protein HanRHA438_Chr03g0144451 [Helianthus annuus]